MSRRYFSCLQLLGPALVDDEGTEFATVGAAQLRNSDRETHQHGRMALARSRRIGVDAGGRVIARHPGHRKLQSKFPNRSCLRTRPSRSVPLAGWQLTCLHQHRSTATLSKQHPNWPTNRALLNQQASSIRVIELRLATDVTLSRFHDEPVA